MIPSPTVYQESSFDPSEDGEVRFLLGIVVGNSKTSVVWLNSNEFPLQHLGSMCIRNMTKEEFKNFGCLVVTKIRIFNLVTKTILVEMV